MEHELNGKTLLLVAVPKSMGQGKVNVYTITGTPSFVESGSFNSGHPFYSTSTYTSCQPISLPQGNWQYIATTETISEEQCAALVRAIGPDEIGWNDTVFVDYIDENSFYYFADDSFASWLQSIGVTTNHALLIKTD